MSLPCWLAYNVGVCVTIKASLCTLNSFFGWFTYIGNWQTYFCHVSQFVYVLCWFFRFKNNFIPFYSVLFHRWTIANNFLPVQQIALQSPSSLRDSVLLPKMHDAVLFRPKNSTAIQLLLPFPLKCRFRFADETHNGKKITTKPDENRWI